MCEYGLIYRYKHVCARIYTYIHIYMRVRECAYFVVCVYMSMFHATKHHTHTHRFFARPFEFPRGGLARHTHTYIYIYIYTYLNTSKSCMYAHVCMCIYYGCVCVCMLHVVCHAMPCHAAMPCNAYSEVDINSQLVLRPQVSPIES